MGHHDVGGVTERGGGHGLALGIDDLRPLLPLGLGLTGHRPLHAVGQLDVLELDQGDLHAPFDGGDVEDLADVPVDGVGLGQGLVQGVLSDHLAQGGLRDLVDRGADALDGDDGLHRVHDPEVGDGRDVDADIVAGDDALRLDRHGDDPQRHPVQDVDEGDDQAEPRPALPQDPSQPEQHPLLVLFDDLQCHRRHHQEQQGDDNDDGDDNGHGWSSVRDAGRPGERDVRPWGRGSELPPLSPILVPGVGSGQEPPGAGNGTGRPCPGHRSEPQAWTDR